MNLKNFTLVKQTHTLLFSLLAHLIPGILILAFYLLANTLFIKAGFYSLTALTVSFLLIGVTVPIIYLRFLAKKNQLKLFKGVILYNNKLPLWQLIILPIIVIAMAIIISIATQPISSYLAETLSNTLPQWFLKPEKIPDTISYNNVLITLILVLIVDGILHPIVEEIYFRGYLMPRLEKYKAFAPIIAALFFALFHLWQPHNFITIFLMSIPWLYLIWWKKSFVLSIIVHCLANSIGAISSLSEFLS